MIEKASALMTRTPAPTYEPIPLPDYQAYPAVEMQSRADAFTADLVRRHTVRNFSSEPVSRRLIETCLKAALSAPSGANHQPWHFSVIGDAARKARIRVEAEAEEKVFYERRAGAEWLEALKPYGTDPSKPFLEIAPWLIVIFGAAKSPSADGRVRKNYYVPESVGIATGFLVAALHHAGLATLTHTPSPMGFLNALCDRPASEKPYILLVVGHPAAGATIPRHATEKKSLAQATTFLE